MNKFKSIFAAVLCFILVIASIPTSASASSDYLPMMPVEKLNNKYVFSKLRTSVSSSVNSRNYSKNKANNNINLFVYDQDNVNMMVGESPFSEVVCEIAACFNATV